MATNSKQAVLAGAVVGLQIFFKIGVLKTPIHDQINLTHFLNQTL